MNWFRNLKKWQKGVLIGCAVGLLLAVVIILSYEIYRGVWVADFHSIFFGAIWSLSYIVLGEGDPHKVALAIYIGSAVIVIFYGILGAVFGRFQQITKPVWKWLLTCLLALFLLVFYVMNYCMS